MWYRVECSPSTSAHTKEHSLLNQNESVTKEVMKHTSRAAAAAAAVKLWTDLLNVLK